MSDSRSEFAIDVRDVAKTYRGKVRALRGIDMRVHAGEIFGLLGPNGAGKSTLVKIMMTVVRASRATGTLLGSPLGHKPTLARVGYLPESHRLPRYLTGEQVLEFYGALARVGRSERRRRAAALIETVGMTSAARRRVGGYSKGMLQRIGLAQALVNDPELVVLDEPTDGVDPMGRRQIRDVLIELRRQGKTIFLNSHLLSELEMVCDRVAILVDGRVAEHGTIEDLTAESRRYEVEIEGPAPEWAASDPAIRVAETGNGRRRLVVMGAEPGPVQALIDRLRKDDRTIVSMRPVRETLEDLFMRSVADSESEEALAAAATAEAAR